MIRLLMILHFGLQVAHQADERDWCPDIAIVEETLVEDGEQRVEDGAVSFENLVDESHIGLRQIPLHFPDVLIVFQLPHR